MFGNCKRAANTKGRMKAPKGRDRGIVLMNNIPEKI